MEEFSLIFRQPTPIEQPTPEEAKSVMAVWNDWIGNLAAEGRYIPGGRLGNDGKVLRQSGVITDGPFIEIREQLLGFITVKAEDLDEAVTLAHGCPVLKSGGTVEVRSIIRGKLLT